MVGIGQIGNVKVYADCFSGIGTTSVYAQGQQDATYDHVNNLQYNPVAACCHSDDYDQQFAQGYNAEWNQYQSQSANVNVESRNRRLCKPEIDSRPGAIDIRLWESV